MDDKNALLNNLKTCDEPEFKDWIMRLLSNLNITECQWQSSADGTYNMRAFDNTNNRDCLITARQYSMLVVDINEMKQFVEILSAQGMERGIFITTSSFPTEVKRYIQDGRENISIIDGGVMTRYLQRHDLFGYDLKVPKTTIPSSNAIQDNQRTIPRMREQKKLLRVTFPDGTVFCDKSPSQTLLQTIKHIGSEKVASLGMEGCHIPLVSQTINEHYREWIKPIGDGWFAMLQSDTDQKFRQIISINNQLQLNLIVEMDASIIAKSNIRNKRDAKKAKSQLMVTFADGHIVAGINTTETFVNFVEYIGADKVSRINLSMGGKSIVTPVQRYNGQVQISNGKWLTVPNTTKDKYKIIKVISSMAHTSCDITII